MVEVSPSMTEYQENLKRVDENFSKAMKEMTAKSVAHCDKFIDKTKAPIDPKDYLQPWSQERIEQTRRKLREQTKEMPK